MLEAVGALFVAVGMRRLRSPTRAIVAANVGAAAASWAARRNVCGRATRRIIAAGQWRVGEALFCPLRNGHPLLWSSRASAWATSLLSLRHCSEPHDNALHNPPATHPDRNHGCPLRGSVALCAHNWRTWAIRIGRRGPANGARSSSHSVPCRSASSGRCRTEAREADAAWTSGIGYVALFPGHQTVS
jgi:hypothetical protein